MKVRPSVKKICEKCKVLKEMAELWLSARTQDISKDKANKIILIEAY